MVFIDRYVFTVVVLIRWMERSVTTTGHESLNKVEESRHSQVQILYDQRFVRQFECRRRPGVVLESFVSITAETAGRSLTDHWCLFAPWSEMTFSTDTID